MPIQWLPTCFSGGKAAGAYCRQLTSTLVPWLRISGAIPLLPLALTKTTIPSTVYCKTTGIRRVFVRENNGTVRASEGQGRQKNVELRVCLYTPYSGTG